MVRRKYFFFDYDGTLALPRTREIPHSTRVALEQLEARGHFVALATGRLQANAQDYIASLGITNLVADGGNSVTIDGEVRWMDPLELEPVKRCLRGLDEAGIPWAVTTANELVRYSANPDFAVLAGDYYVPTCIKADLTIENLTEVYKVYIPCELGKEKNLDLSDVPWIRYNPDTVFIEPMDKQRGIKRMMDELGGPYEDVVVFGDGFNDVTMFTSEWTSIAMGNAREVLKERADFITANCDDDGIMKACVHYGWISPDAVGLS